jgi:hypothetical protein
VRLREAYDGSASGRFHTTSIASMAMRSAVSSYGCDRWSSCVGTRQRPVPTRARGGRRPLRFTLLVRIVAVPDLAVLDRGEGTIGYVDGRLAHGPRVAGAQVVECDAGGVWEAIEDVYAARHAAGERERPGIGLRLGAVAAGVALGRHGGSADTTRGHAEADDGPNEGVTVQAPRIWLPPRYREDAKRRNGLPKLLTGSDVGREVSPSPAWNGDGPLRLLPRRIDMLAARHPGRQPGLAARPGR